MKRREFLKKAAAVPGSAWLVEEFAEVARAAPSPLSRFQLGAISDEFSQDFEEALKVMKSYGLQWVEIRTLWKIYSTETSPEQLRRLKDLLEKYAFKVSVLDTALYKCTLPGTQPLSNEKDAYPYSGQMDLLKRAMERAQALGTDRLRVFAFWRVAEPQKHFPRISEELSKAAEVARSGGMRLVLENESICNVSTGHELAEVLKRVPAANFGANWDVGNGYWNGEVSYPTGYAALDKRRIWHLHLKDVRCASGYKNCATAIVGTGQVDLPGQLRALVRDGYQGTMSLEPEYEDSRITHLDATKRSLEAVLKMLATALA
jgi:sugar phosphate isomerase/epimerase